MNHHDDFPERNPVTYARHRREVLWQISVPLAITLALALGAAFLAVQAATDQARWANISLIWLIMLTMVGSLLLLALLAGLLYLVVMLLDRLPSASLRALGFFLIAGVRVRQFDRALTEPFVRFLAFKASLRSLLRNLGFR